MNGLICTLLVMFAVHLPSPLHSMPDSWLTGADGGCRVLVSPGLGGGMFGQGYAQCADAKQHPFCAELPTWVGGEDEFSWRIPVLPTEGWFVTAEEGDMGGAGESSGTSRESSESP